MSQKPGYRGVLEVTPDFAPHVLWSEEVKQVPLLGLLIDP